MIAAFEHVGNVKLLFWLAGWELLRNHAWLIACSFSRVDLILCFFQKRLETFDFLRTDLTEWLKEVSSWSEILEDAVRLPVFSRRYLYRFFLGLQ